MACVVREVLCALLPQASQKKSNLSPEMKKRLREEYVGFGGSSNTVGGSHAYLPACSASPALSVSPQRLHVMSISFAGPERQLLPVHYYRYQRPSCLLQVDWCHLSFGSQRVSLGGRFAGTCSDCTFALPPRVHSLLLCKPTLLLHASCICRFLLTCSAIGLCEPQTPALPQPHVWHMLWARALTRRCKF